MQGNNQAASAIDMTAMAAEVIRAGVLLTWPVVATPLACHDSMLAAGVSTLLPVTSLQEVQDFEWTVQLEATAPLLVLLKRPAVRLKLAVIEAVGPEEQGTVPLQLWASKQLVFPDTDSTGQPKSLPSQFVQYNGIRAASRPAYMQEAQIDYLPSSRSICTPVLINLAASSFNAAAIMPRVLGKAVQAWDDASLSVASALVLAKQQGNCQLPK